MKRNLVLYFPVLHKGYLDFLEKYKKTIEVVYIIDSKFVSQFSDFEPDIAAIPSLTTKSILEKLGYKKIIILNKKNISILKKNPVFLIDDEVSRNLYKQFLQKEDVQWSSVFLRWDSDKVKKETLSTGITSKNSFDKKMMKRAYEEAQKSSDWWRQVGAVLVKNKKAIFCSYNQGTPSDHAIYQKGNLRDFLKVGERPDLSNSIHAEQLIVADAAKEGSPLKGADLYVTHFPCLVCAKLIAFSGIKNCYFSEGSANLDGEKILTAAKVKIIRVKV